MTDENAARLRAIGLDPDDPLWPGIAAECCLDLDAELSPRELKDLAYERYLCGEGPWDGPYWDAWIAAWGEYEAASGEAATEATR